MKSRLKIRHRKERWFRRAGLMSLVFALSFLGLTFGTILYEGIPSFFRTEILAGNAPSEFYNPHAIYQEAGESDWIPASSEVNLYYKKGFTESLSPEQIRSIEDLKNKNAIRISFNSAFFTHGDSREPELAGIWGGLIGSLLTLIVTFLTAFPLGVGTALYLEEFAPKTRLTHWIEANINNLAAIPSILFGLLGLVIFIQLFGLPRPSALVGGLTLGLMSLPVIIVATRAALSTVSSAVKEAAIGMGATRLQVLFHHVIPLAMPGITTGVLLSLARALGETAPLLMIGMVAFIASTPSSFLEPATVLPVQIFNWSRSPELGFIEDSSGALIVLLALLGLLNGAAIFIRRKFET